MPYAYDLALLTDTGRVRPFNEDAIGHDPASGLFILADGLGGYNAGEVASAMAVSSLLARLPAQRAQALEQGGDFDPEAALHDAIVHINADIFNAAAHSNAYSGMATTLVAAWLLGEELWVAHAGDSRLYRLRGDLLEQITRDHSFSQELLDAGMVSEEEARNLPAKNLVTRALGAEADLEPEIHCHRPAVGDLYLLCSDGLSEMIGASEIGGLLAAGRRDPALAARRLVAMANEAGGRDNVSVIVIRLQGPAAAVAEA
jgi:protein phosphatase